VSWTRAVTTALTGFILAACATDPVLLRDRTSGFEVQCGPFPTFPRGTVLAYEQERECVAGYQRRGYERVPVR
jgi:hypothetical protein